jgi:hypothetical protein
MVRKRFSSPPFVRLSLLTPPPPKSLSTFALFFAGFRRARGKQVVKAVNVIANGETTTNQN